MQNQKMMLQSSHSLPTIMEVITSAYLAALFIVPTLLYHCTRRYTLAALCTVPTLLYHYTRRYTLAALCTVPTLLYHYSWRYTLAALCTVPTLLYHYSWRYNSIIPLLATLCFSCTVYCSYSIILLLETLYFIAALCTVSTLYYTTTRGTIL